VFDRLKCRVIEIALRNRDAAKNADILGGRCRAEAAERLTVGTRPPTPGGDKFSWPAPSYQDRGQSAPPRA